MVGRESDLKLDMLEAVDTIATNGKIYRWAEYVTDMVKTICERCQETGGIIRFPSLILWIVMYHICPEGNQFFQEPTRFHMWRFKPFSQKGTLKELEDGKVMNPMTWLSTCSANSHTILDYTWYFEFLLDT